MDAYQKLTDTISWDRITGFPSEQYAMKSYVDQNFSMIDHTHQQYILKTEVETLYATKQELSTEIEGLSTVYAPIRHTHTMDDIVGYVDNTPKFMQFVRPVEAENLFLKVEIFSDPTMETLVKTIDSRTDEGRLAMSYDNGTAFVAFPAAGEPTDGEGRFTLVHIGEVATAGQMYIRWTWQNAVASFTLTSHTTYPSFTPSNMFSVGNYWRNL